MASDSTGSSRLFAGVEIAWLVFFRVAFSALMLIESLRYLLTDRVRLRYSETEFHFSYFGFDWVQPWPGYGMTLHFAGLVLLSLAMGVGLFYRAAAAFFFLGFSYVYLIDKAYYLNHYYLVCLLSFLFIFLPAHRAFSLDALRRPELRSPTTPAWTLWLLRTQIGLVYFFAGIAKLNSDWLGGEPLRTWMGRKTELPLMGPFLVEEWVIFLMSYGSLLIDLLAFPFLLWRKSRLLMTLALLVFHLTNAVFFNIGIFPWLMILSIVVFYPPDLIVRVKWLRSFFSRDPVAPPEASRPGRSRRRLTLTLLALYLVFQLLVPLRHFLYPGNAAWTEEGHRFSWRMLLRSKDGWVRFVVKEPESGKSWVIDPEGYLSKKTAHKMSCVPDMILQFSHYLAADLETQGYANVEIRVRAKVSLNGRPYQLLVDPDVDLTKEQLSLLPASWILPLETR